MIVARVVCDFLSVILARSYLGLESVTLVPICFGYQCMYDSGPFARSTEGFVSGSHPLGPLVVILLPIWEQVTLVPCGLKRKRKLV